MKSIIVGSAGHIDHGKTALVKALTGIDADRLAEEKRRGITIDIGFANLDLTSPAGEPIRLGFVDVPGHERFVRNMLAGVGGIDLVLLVIAADEGIKPQTREHFDICRLLSVQRGITVLTKSDLVDQETIEVVRLEVADFLRGSFLDGAPIIPVSSLRGTGLEQLKQQLFSAATEIPVRESAAIPRLPIDRVFTMKGFGTVVTGTLIAGTIRKEDELELFPSRKKIRVRGVQVHGAPAEHAVAGQRTALNLAAVATDELARGMTLSRPRTFQATSRVDVELSSLPAAKPLKDRARVHFHAYTEELIAEVALYGRKQVAPGEKSFARLRLAHPVLLLPGDRFIIRQFSPVLTIGGGVVLENNPPARVKNAENHSDYLELLPDQSRHAVLRARVTARGAAGLSLTEAVARIGWDQHEIESLASKIPEITNVASVLIHNLALQTARKSLIQVISGFHRQNPLVAGMSRQELRERLAGLEPEVFAKIFDDAVTAGQIELAGELVRLPGHDVVLKDEEAESRKLIEQAFTSAGLKVPALKDVLGGLKIDRGRAQKIVTLLLREKILIKVSEDLVFHQSALAELRKSVAAEKLRSPKIDVSRFKDLTGVSRKYAIPLLEYLDRERVTKRVGQERVI